MTLDEQMRAVWSLFRLLAKLRLTKTFLPYDTARDLIRRKTLADGRRWWLE
jgi:hypothetical protein